MSIVQRVLSRFCKMAVRGDYPSEHTLERAEFHEGNGGQYISIVQSVYPPTHPGDTPLYTCFEIAS